MALLGERDQITIINLRLSLRGSRKSSHDDFLSWTGRAPKPDPREFVARYLPWRRTFMNNSDAGFFVPHPL
jgi:hypothetical protein